MLMIIMPLLLGSPFFTGSDNFVILGVKWSSCVHQNPELSRISSEEQREKEIQIAQENRLKRGH